RAVDHRLTGVPERDQMTAEISAVDRRHVLRVERTAIARVVPVVKVAPEALEAVHRLERGLQSFDRVAGADPSEIAGGDDGEEVEADVRRGRAMRDDWTRRFLEVVRRQRVTVPADERREEAPRPPRAE